MRGRLTLDKVNIAINDIGGYADATAQLITNTKKKVNAILAFIFCFLQSGLP